MKKTLLYLTVIVFLASCGAAKTDDKQAELDKLKKERSALDEKIKTLEEQIKAVGGDTIETKKELVTVATIVEAPFTSYIDLQAKVDADQNVTVTAQMPGTVQRIYVTEGQNVSAGSTLAELDNDAASKQLQTLESQLSFAKDIYAKQKSLWDQKIGTEVQYLSAKNNVETLEKQLDAAKEQLEMSKLVSPISGVVDNVDIKVGQIASPGFNGIRVVNTSSLKVKGEVSEAYSAYVQNGDKVKLYFPDLDQEVESKITFVSKVINPQTRTFTAESKIASGNTFKPNMIVIMKIADYENNKAISVDVNMVQKSSDASYVYVAAWEGGKNIAQRRTVTVGKIYGGRAEITSGLKAGDKIVASGYSNLVNGQEIKF
ncbi:MAG: efflux RND transporter periplasmic adaptor subunit [Chitinophagales bacterium]